MNNAQMTEALDRNEADLHRGEQGVEAATALPFDSPEASAHRSNALAMALGRQSEILSRVREVNKAIREELDN